MAKLAETASGDGPPAVAAKSASDYLLPFVARTPRKCAAHLSLLLSGFAVPSYEGGHVYASVSRVPAEAEW